MSLASKQKCLIFTLKVSKMKTFLLYSFLFFLMLLSCKSKEEKEIQGNLNQLQGQWVIKTFTVSSPLPDSLSQFFKSGELNFGGCGYRPKQFENPARDCGGEAVINGVNCNLSHRYFYNSVPFDLTVIPLNSSDKNFITISWLFAGSWEFVIDGNSLNARQVRNNSSPTRMVTFTATRK